MTIRFLFALVLGLMVVATASAGPRRGGCCPGGVQATPAVVALEYGGVYRLAGPEVPAALPAPARRFGDCAAGTCEYPADVTCGVSASEGHRVGLFRRVVHRHEPRRGCR